MNLQLTDAELHEWAKMRADDAGRLARELVACRLQSQAAVAAAYEKAARVAVDRKGFGSDAALVHPYDKGYVAACDAITTAIRALATPDQIAALAAKIDASQAPNPAVNGGRCQSGTITLPRAEVKALMEAAKRGVLQADENQWSERWYFDACVFLAILQERMK